MELGTSDTLESTHIHRRSFAARLLHRLDPPSRRAWSGGPSGTVPEPGFYGILALYMSGVLLFAIDSPSGAAAAHTVRPDIRFSVPPPPRTAPWRFVRIDALPFGSAPLCSELSRSRGILSYALHRNTSGEMRKKSASRRIWVLLRSRFPLSTLEATLREPKTGTRSACRRPRCAMR